MPRTVKRILLIAAAFALFVVPAAAIAAAGFTDVADDSVFVADIQWMKDNDITRGCNPPANDRYCPSNYVTREQMSAFMHRLAANQVVDAATAIEADHATSADDADMLDGMDSTAFLGKTEKAVDSDELDGMDSTAFKSLVASDTVQFADSIVVPASVNTPALGVTGFSVPAGGAITATASNVLGIGGGGLGVLWIEVDGTGTCDVSVPVVPLLLTVGAAAPLEGVTSQISVAASAGAHRVDLCALTSVPGGIYGNLIVEWHESVSGAGLLGTGNGMSPAEMLASYES